MKQTVTHSHELFAHDDTIEIVPRVYQGDVGSMEIAVDFTRDGQPLDLSDCAVTVTNRAPNNTKVVMVGGAEAPVVVAGGRVTWTLGTFDTQQVGTYLAQIHAATSEQNVTVVFVKYNVERSVSGNIVTLPVQYTTFSALVELVQGLKADVEEALAQTEEMRELYDLFCQILEDNGVTWNTLRGKPETFPPSLHTHEEFQTLQDNINNLDGKITQDAAALNGKIDAKADKSKVLSGALLASGWTDTVPYTQVMLIDGMTETLNAVAEVVHDDNVQKEMNLLSAWSCVTRLKQSDGAVTFECLKRKPAFDMTVEFMVVG